MKYTVIKSHSSEFPNAMQLKAGDSLLVGERYSGPEKWSDWYLCQAPGQEPGWVPLQAISFHEDGSATALTDYSAQEMDVEKGEIVEGHLSLNGWIWCTSAVEAKQGWVPEENLLPQSLGF